MSLGQYFKISLRNGAGSSGTFVVTGRFWKYASDGSLTYDSSETTLFSSASIASGAWADGTAINNSSNLWTGCDLTVVCSTSLAHLVTVQRKVSTDGGSTYPSDGYGIGVGSVYASSAATPTASLRMV